MPLEFIFWLFQELLEDVHAKRPWENFEVGELVAVGVGAEASIFGGGGRHDKRNVRVGAHELLDWENLHKIGIEKNAVCVWREFATGKIFECGDRDGVAKRLDHRAGRARGDGVGGVCAVAVEDEDVCHGGDLSVGFFRFGDIVLLYQKFSFQARAAFRGDWPGG